MTKVFYDGCIFYKQRHGGVSVVFKEIFKRIGKCRDLHLVCTVPCPNSHPDLYGIHKLYIPFLIPGKISSVLWAICNEIYLRIYNPDIFHSTFFSTPRLPHHYKTVLTIHDMIYELFSEKFNTMQDRRFVKNKKKQIYSADAIICVSESTQKDVLRFYPDIDAEKLVVIHNGIDPSFLTPVDPVEKNRFQSQLGLEKPFLLYIGRVNDPYKNFDLLLDTYTSRDEIQKRFHLVIVHSDDLNERQKETIASMDGRIKCYSDITRRQLKLFYSCCSEFIYPSRYEGFGLPVLEAMACEAPVVCSNALSLLEIAGDAALFFDPLSEEDLGNSILQIADSPRTREDLQNKGRKNLERFSWEHSVEALEKLYIKLHST